MQYILGVDVGGTNVVVGTVAEDGSAVHGLVQVPTDVRGGADAVVRQIEDLTRRSLDQARTEVDRDLEVIGVGVGSPGPLDVQRGVVLVTPNLGWRDYPLRDRVSQAVGLPATLDNDANCAIFGEWWRGAARDASIVIGFTIGTGIGGGIVVDGKIFHGANDVAGEFGHTTIDATGRRCGCGNYGCLEAYASGPAIAARAVEELEVGVRSRLSDMAGGDLRRITAQMVYEAAREGDQFARDLVKDTARFLGIGIANLTNIFNPEMVVVVGGVTHAGDQLFNPLRAEVTRRAFRPAVAGLRIVPGTLEGPGVWGAAAAFKVQTRGEA